MTTPGRLFGPTLVLLAAAAVVLVSGTGVGVAVTTAPPPANGIVCIMDGLVFTAQHQYFAAGTYYRSRYPLTNWSIRVLPSFFNSRTTVRAYVLNGTDCNILHAAVSSTTTLALSPLVDDSVAWVDAGSMTTELSDVVANPSFNRVSPTADIGTDALARFATAMNWSTMAIMCDNVAIGRGMAETYSAAYTSLGGSVTISRCIESDATAADINPVLDEIVAHKETRVLFVAAARQAHQNDVLYRTMAAHGGLGTNVQILLSTSNCVPPVLQMFPGSACVVAAQTPLYDDFLAQYLTRDVAAERAAFVDAGRPGAVYDATKFIADAFGAFGTDSVRLAMEAYYTYPGANKTRYPTLAQYVRSISFEGVSGQIALKPNGDRIRVDYAIVNSQPVPGTNVSVTPPDVVRVGIVENAVMTRYPTPSDRPGRYFWFDGAYSNTAPSSVPPVAASSASDGMPTWLVVVIIAAMLILAAVAVALIMSRATASTGPDYTHCPVDPAQPLVVFFVAVHGLAHLWDACDGDSVTAALEVVAKLVRTAVRDHQCHEARRLDASTFMLVAKTPEAAMRCAAAITDTVNVATAWPKILTAQVEAGAATRTGTVSGSGASSRSHSRSQSNRSSGYRQRRSAAGGSSTVHRKSDAGTAKRGVHGESRNANVDSAVQRARRRELVVSIGAAHGFASVDFDPEHHVLAYHGLLLDEAAAVADTAVGGQIVVTPSVVDALEESGAAPHGMFTVYRDIVVASATHNRRAGDRGSAAVTAPVVPTTVTLRTFMPAGYGAADDVRADIVEEVARLERMALAANADDDDGGSANARGASSTSILGALSSASTGAASRQVGVIIVDIPALADTRTRAPAEHARFCQRVVGELTSVAASNRAHVHDVIGTRVIVTVNAVGDRRVAQPAVVAIDTALQLSRHVECHPELHYTMTTPDMLSSVGVAAGLAIAGVSTSTGSRDVALAAGALLRAAGLAQGASRSLRLPLVCYGIDAEELRTRFVAATVDVATARPDSDRALPVMAVTAARADSGNEEWLYLVGASGPSSDPRDPEVRWGVVVKAVSADATSAIGRGATPANPSAPIQCTTEDLPNAVTATDDEGPTHPLDLDDDDAANDDDSASRGVALARLAEAESHDRPRAYARLRHLAYAAASL